MRRNYHSRVNDRYNSRSKTRSVVEEQKPNTVNLEQVHDTIKRTFNTNELDCIFKPKSICVIDDFNPEIHSSPVPVPSDSISSTLARNVLWNLMSVSQVKVYAVSKHVERVLQDPNNKRRPHLLGVQMYSSLRELYDNKASTSNVPLNLDLAVICCHQVETMFTALEECIKHDVKGCVIIGSVYSKFYEKFAENQAANIEKMKDILRGSEMRVIGPGMGLITPLMTKSGQYHVGEIYNNFLNITPTNRSSELTRGKVAIISQSGALATTILDWSLKQGGGLSGFACVGADQVDVNFADMVEHFGNDNNTDAILLYIEDLGNNEHIKRFASAARNIALKKPIIAMKMNSSNRSEDNHLNTLFERVGILRVNSIEEMFYMSQTIGKQAITKGNTITVISNSGGAATLAVDAIYQSEITELGSLSPKSAKLLQESGIDVEEALLSGKKAIPVNIRNTATPEQYVAALDIVYNDPKTDSVLVMLTPQTRTEPTRTAQFLQRYIVEKTKEGKLSKPIMCCFMGGRDVEAGRSILLNAGIPAFAFPEIATKVFQYNYRYSKNLENLYEDPSLLDNDHESQNDAEAKAKAREYLKSLLKHNPNKELLNEFESQHLLSIYGIDVPQTKVVTTVEEAVEAAKLIGFPVVLKIHSVDSSISKLDMGGVIVGLSDEKQVRQGFISIKQAAEKSNVKFAGVTVQNDCKKLVASKKDSIAFELYIGAEVDPQFGPVISFGTGGSLHQIYKDKSFGIPPLTAPLAYQMLRKTKISDALVERFRNKPAIDIEGLKSLLVKFSKMVLDNCDLIKNFEINPLQAAATEREKTFVALDCKMVLHKPGSKKTQPVIRSYERKYVTKFNDDIIIRPSKFSDFKKLMSFFANLSPKTLETSLRETALRSQYALAFLNLKNQYNKAKNDAPQPLDPYALTLTTDSDSKSIYQELVQFVSSDFDREVVLFAIDKRSKAIIGMGVYTILQKSIISGRKRKAEVALLIGEQAQGKGIGKYILDQLIQIAKNEGNISQMIAYANESNVGMLKLCARAGFQVQENEELANQGVIVSTLDL
ncbi:hypothetical protein FDP41_006314 [Naegleria fowleri]|uniref:N-acetyltransferase domain-containing protein n=1 Tax=Naegleria fowleri TaxID=5763 RepID=A0A6A5BLE6_NAEFO|nr:uncharacterized protein FDP41_006314 [Naegleria fowleri]KAF0974840.1 hypothetical protein FDP41_006314 [Naegleria fowleri]